MRILKSLWTLAFLSVVQNVMRFKRFDRVCNRILLNIRPQEGVQCLVSLHVYMYTDHTDLEEQQSPLALLFQDGLQRRHASKKPCDGAQRVSGLNLEEGGKGEPTSSAALRHVKSRRWSRIVVPRTLWTRLLLLCGHPIVKGSPLHTKRFVFRLLSRCTAMPCAVATTARAGNHCG